MKTFYSFLLGAVAVLALGFASANLYTGTFTGTHNGNGTGLTNVTAANFAVGATLPAANAAALTNLNASNLASGTVAIARLPGNVLTNLSTAPWTNSSGDLTLESSGNTFLQMYAGGSPTGHRYFDWFNGGGQLILRRKSDSGATVSGNILTITNDVVTFGAVPTAASYRSTATNAVIVPCPNGGSFILTVDDAGTLVVVTNTTSL